MPRDFAGMGSSYTAISVGFQCNGNLEPTRQSSHPIVVFPCLGSLCLELQASFSVGPPEIGEGVKKKKKKKKETPDARLELAALR